MSILLSIAVVAGLISLTLFYVQFAKHEWLRFYRLADRRVKKLSDTIYKNNLDVFDIYKKVIPSESKNAIMLVAGYKRVVLFTFQGHWFYCYLDNKKLTVKILNYRSMCDVLGIICPSVLDIDVIDFIQKITPSLNYLFVDKKIVWNGPLDKEKIAVFMKEIFYIDLPLHKVTRIPGSRIVECRFVKVLKE